jgi:murein L,D-transpeptidase YcbB/YkuD
MPIPPEKVVQVHIDDVKVYQQLMGLKADGIWGPLTHQKLVADLNELKKLRIGLTAEDQAELTRLRRGVAMLVQGTELLQSK